MKPHLRLHYHPGILTDRGTWSLELVRSSNTWRGAWTYSYSTPALAMLRARVLWWGVGL